MKIRELDKINKEILEIIPRKDLERNYLLLQEACSLTIKEFNNTLESEIEIEDTKLLTLIITTNFDEGAKDELVIKGIADYHKLLKGININKEVEMLSTKIKDKLIEEVRKNDEE